MNTRTRGTCDYCGVPPGTPCIVTLAPEAPPLTVAWNHRAREGSNPPKPAKASEPRREFVNVMFI